MFLLIDLPPCPLPLVDGLGECGLGVEIVMGGGVSSELNME